MAASEAGSYTRGQTWGALRKAWKGYKIAKAQKDTAKQQEYANKIRTLQGQLEVPLTSFPEIGIP